MWQLLCRPRILWGSISISQVCCKAQPLYTFSSLRLVAVRNSQQVKRSFQSTSRSAAGDTSRSRLPRPVTIAAAATVSAIVFLNLPLHRPTAENSSSSGDAAQRIVTDKRDPSQPRFRLSSVREHGSTSARPWVTWEDRVYDITDWIPAHPGGDVILRAAGGPVEPYWDIFSIHRSVYVREVLAQYQIGLVAAEDLGNDGLPLPGDAIADPFADDPPRDERLVTHTVRPLSAEPGAGWLDASFVTPNELFYVRNHMWVPPRDGAADSGGGGSGEQHVLTVELPSGEQKTYTVHDLRRRFRHRRVTAALQCSGNRRGDMTRHAGHTNGLQWGVGAIGNAQWEGVRLRDVLVDAGLREKTDDQAPASGPGVSAANTTDEQDGPDPTTHHVQFSGLEAYGASIPLATAMDPRADVLLAFGMNGADLPRDHGYPLRAIVPGHVAARSVKWLSRVCVADEESTSQWQRRDYKSFGPNEGPEPDWDRAAAIQEMPVTSAITRVDVGRENCTVDGADAQKSGVVDPAAANTSLADTSGASRKSIVGQDGLDKMRPKHDPVSMQGYAYSGGGREIRRVDVSLDDGQTWDQAELLDDCRGDCRGSKHWAWKRWRYSGHLPRPPVSSHGNSAKPSQDGCTTLVVKAIDDAYNTQPDSHSAIYNVRGNLATAWHRVRVCPKCTGADGQSVIWSTVEMGRDVRSKKEEEREKAA